MYKVKTLKYGDVEKEFQIFSFESICETDVIYILNLLNIQADGNLTDVLFRAIVFDNIDELFKNNIIFEY